MDDAGKIISFVRKSLELLPETPVEWFSLSARGSDRSYYRLKWNETESVLLMRYNPQRYENRRFVDIANFLVSIHVPTPRILVHDPENYYILMQDLGDKDLWAMKNNPWKTRRILYQQTLRAIEPLHACPVDLFPADPALIEDAFGPSLYRWERDYFKEHFISGFCGFQMEANLEKQLETELEALAERLTALPRCLVHRDLQSQNVMLYNDQPVFIDFQGMRVGTFFYDLGSLLYDPYVDFSENEREELLDFYFRNSGSGLDWNRFRQSFLEASVQRLMQALGAYAFLGIRKGLKEYLAYIDPGLRNLSTASCNAGTFPNLQVLVSRCGEIHMGSGYRTGV
jgi:aminoglycoside/choline kinase family phosphotransferase